MSDIEDQLEDEDKDELRTAIEVARRCVVLYAVVAAGHKEPRPYLVKWLRHERLWDSVSPEEAAFLQSPRPTRQQIFNATWRVEAILPLLWALGLIDELPPPTATCDVPLVQATLPRLLEPTAEFVAKATLRDEVEIWETYEETYQAHWAVRDAELNNKPIPHEYDPGIVQERHHALNWLIGYCGQSWDDVTTDT